MVDIAVISGSKSDQAIADKVLRRLEEMGRAMNTRSCPPTEIRKSWSSISPLPMPGSS